MSEPFTVVVYSMTPQEPKFKITLNKDEEEHFHAKERVFMAKNLTGPQYSEALNAYLKAMKAAQEKARIRNRELQIAALQAWQTLPCK